MSLLEIVIIAAALLSVFSLGSVFLQHQRKSENHYTYWFENVDELLRK
jgi:hypothetical protein